MEDLHWCFLGRIGFEEGRRLQAQLATLRQRDEIGDILLLLEHPPVITVGRHARSGLGDEHHGVPVVRTDRGGQVTYHGPGQVVGYPVCRLPVRGRGVRRFVAAIEHSLCDLALGLGVGLMPRRGLPGAWTGPGENPRKVGFVGLGVHRAVTMHGFALNLDRRSIDGFEGIEVCGLPGVEVSSLESLGACPPPEAELLAGRLARALSVRSDRRWVPTPLAAEDLPVGDFAGARAFSDRLDGRRRLERSRDHSRALFLG